ncbi:MAG TPA: pilus assembly protein PilM [Planctomycetota bacterium]|jgi:type IV pilus assembly protein PilM
MAGNTVWGVDIGNSAIKVVKLTRGGPDECMIVDFDIVDMPILDDEKERTTRLREVLADIAKKHKFGGDHVYVSVPGNLCLHREFQLPPGSEDKLADLVQYEARQQIPFPLDQVEWGFERYEDPSGVGVALIAVRKNDIQELLATCASAGLNVHGVTAGPLCLFNFVQYEFRPENTVLILDAGSKGTDFVVMNKRQVYFRTIQIAGREITRVLENKFKVPFDKAEDLKKNISKSPQLDKILSVIEPTVRQLGAEVQRTIGFYKGRARGARIGQCYLLGHTFRLPKMAEYLQTQVREAPFAIVEGLQRVKMAADLNTEVWNNEFPTMAVAIGLGLQGLGMSELKVNLLPQTVQKHIEVDTWKPWAAAAVVAILLTLGYSYTQAVAMNQYYAKTINDFKGAVVNSNKYSKEKEQAMVGMEQLRVEADRWTHLARDRGKLTPLFANLVGLRQKNPDGTDGKPFFGTEAKMFLTSAYVSRMPLGGQGGLPEPAERVSLRSHDSLLGKNSIYKAYANDKIEEPLGAPLEMRPEVPLLVVLCGEIEAGAGARRKVSDLEDYLKKMPEVQDIRAECIEKGPEYIEQIPEYEWKGELKVPEVKPGAVAPVAAPADPTKEKKFQYSSFQVMFRWNDPKDPDRAPKERGDAASATKAPARPAARPVPNR